VTVSISYSRRVSLSFYLTVLVAFPFSFAISVSFSRFGGHDATWVDKVLLIGSSDVGSLFGRGA